MSPGGLPGRLITVGTGTLLLSLGVIREGRLGRVLRPGRVVPLLPRRGQLFLRGPRLLLGGGRRLPRLGQPRLGLPRGQARLPPISLGLLGPGLKPGPGLLGRRDLRFQPGPQPGLVPLGVLAGLRHLLLRGPAHPVQLRPSRRGRLPRLGQPRLSLSLRSTRLPRISLGPLPAPPEHRTPADPGPPGRPTRHLAGPAPSATGTRSAPDAAPRSPGPAARSTPASPPPPPLYYSPGLLHGILLSSGRRLGDLGGLEPGVVVVPSGAGLVAAPPS